MICLLARLPTPGRDGRQGSKRPPTRVSSCSKPLRSRLRSFGSSNGAFLIAVIATCLGAIGCSSEDCANTIFTESIQIQFLPTITAVGEYEVAFTSGALNGTCTVAVGGTSLKPCDSAKMTIEGKNGNGVVELKQLRVWFDYAPSTFSLAVRKDENLIYQSSLTPIFETDEPNGKGCGIRHQAIVTVEITP